ncbi:MAG TPA: methylamine dehydrogenase light chain [Rhodanobacter sp.]|jgi:amicyanin-dependent methylamine dehydrogenase small subunit
MRWVDRFGERLARHVTYSSSRRSVLARIGKVLVGAAFIMPVLPIARAAPPRAEGDGDGLSDHPTEKQLSSCDYWRYCGVDGFLCHCCGGTAESCPPGTQYSQVSWVGTCHNPNDGREYMMSYHDCCGRTACDRCSCGEQRGERPGYEFFRHNDVNWCMGNREMVYHCTVSRMLGAANA